MHIQLNFDDLGELHEFVRDYVSRERALTGAAPDKSDPRGPDTRPITAEGAVIPTEEMDAAVAKALSEGENGQQLVDAGEAPSTDPAPEPAAKRKRRTKAEIAADEAVAKAAQDLAPLDKLAALPAANPLDNLKPEPNGLTSSPEIVALAATIDGSDKMAHMNEGRDFIAKHGFPKYNETFALADVPANIAAHTPEQAAMHRAAMRWLIAQAGVA